MSITIFLNVFFDPSHLITIVVIFGRYLKLHADARAVFLLIV